MKLFLSFIVIIVVLAGGVFLFSNKADSPALLDEAVGDLSSAPETDMGVATNEENSAAEKAENVPQESAVAEKKPATHTITYTDTGFSPGTIEIQKGDAVMFMNKSSHNMWVASAMHPTHAVYPEKSPSNCAGSSFDQCDAGKPGTSWSFTFNSVGTWKYHDHVNAGKFGSVVVK